MKTSRWPLSLCGALLGLALAGCQHAYFRALNVGRQIPESVQYDREAQLSLDIHRPANPAANAPVVVFYYGGAWTSGERAFYRFVGTALARHGYLVLIPDYRKAPAHPFPDFMIDAAKAAAWAHENAPRLGGDRARIHLMGHSAGAHIAALLATDQRYLARHGLKPADFASVVGLAGPYDFLPLTAPAVKQALGPAQGWPQTQPVNFVDGDEPPFLLLQGSDDSRVDPGNADRLATRLRAHGVPVSVVMFPRIGHIGLLNGFLSARFSPVLEQCVAWIENPGHRASAR